MSNARGGFTLLQLMLAVALVGIVLGFVTAVRSESQTGGYHAAAFSPDGDQFVVGNWGDWIVFGDTQSGKLGRSYTVQGSVTALAFSPDGNTLAVGGIDGSVRLWDVQRGCEIRALKGQPDPVIAVVFAPDGKRVASGGSDGAVVVWNVATGKTLSSFDHGDSVNWLQFVPGANRLATQSVTGVNVWDLESGTMRDRYTPRNRWIYAAAISPNGRTLALGEGGTVTLYDTVTSGQKAILETNQISSPIAFLDDGMMLVVYEGEDVALWNVSEKERTLEAPGALFDLAWACSDGHALRAIFHPKTIWTWDATRGTVRTVQIHVTPLVSWLLLLGAWYLLTLAWMAATPDTTAAAASIRASVDGRDRVARIAWHDRPAALVGFACTGIALAVGATVLVYAVFGDFVENVPELRRPIVGVAVGLVTGIGFFGHFRLLMRKQRPVTVEKLQVRTRRRLRWDLTRHDLAFATLFLAMVCSAAAAAWVFGGSPFTAFFASYCGVACLYWEKARIVRAAEARMAERGAGA